VIINVAGFKIAVDHALSMRGGQRIDDSPGILQRFIQQQRSSFYDLRERLALDILHHR
jgi:hypothetical protein